MTKGVTKLKLHYVCTQGYETAAVSTDVPKTGYFRKNIVLNTKSDSKCNFKITLAPFLCAEVVNVFGRAAELLSGNAQDNSLVQINFHLGPSLHYVSKETGWMG